MTSPRLSIAIAWALMVLPCGVAAAQREAGAQVSPVDDERLREIIRRVEAEEARYQRLETVVRHASGFAKSTKDEAKWHAIVQDDLFWLRAEETTTFASGEKRVDVSLSAFDGQTTRDIDDRKCVNIRSGRCPPWQIAAPHAWAMYGFPMRLPLSIYLKGGGAIESYRQSQRPPQRADPSEFVRVEATAEPDETIDGLDCARIRLRRWFYGDDHPFIEIVWLAKERNYLCARSEYPAEDTGVLRHEGRVTQWREVQPGLWLPTRVSVVQREPRWEKELAVDEASFDVDYPLSRFRDVVPSQCAGRHGRECVFRNRPAYWAISAGRGRTFPHQR